MEWWRWSSAQAANAGSSGPDLEREGQLQLGRQLKHSWEAFARVSLQISAAHATSPDQPHCDAASVTRCEECGVRAPMSAVLRDLCNLISVNLGVCVAVWCQASSRLKVKHMIHLY